MIVLLGFCPFFTLNYTHKYDVSFACLAPEGCIFLTTFALHHLGSQTDRAFKNKRHDPHIRTSLPKRGSAAPAHCRAAPLA